MRAGCVVVVWFVVARRWAPFFSPAESPSCRRSRIAASCSASVTAPQGSTPQHTADQIKPIEEFYAQIPEAAAYTAISGFPTVVDGNAMLRLKPWEERTKKQQQITDELRPKFASIPGAIAFPINPPSLGQSFRSTPIEFVVMSQVPYPELQRIVDRFLEEVRKYPGRAEPADRPAAQHAGSARRRSTATSFPTSASRVDTVGRTLETMLGGRQVTRFKRDGEQYDVIVQVAPLDRIDARRHQRQLRARARRQHGAAVESGRRHARASRRSRSTTSTACARSRSPATLAPGYAIGEALEGDERGGEGVRCPARRRPTSTASRASSASRAARSISRSCWRSLFIYLVLSAQFESFVHPFVIMLSVPLSMTGALFTLWLAGGTLNIYSQVGLVTLVGLITKHGILIVEFSQPAARQGRGSCSTRSSTPRRCACGRS